jgi:beta-aspartyl-peptidase (threonine type)
MTQAPARNRAVIAIHGGAGTITRDTPAAEVTAYHAALADILLAGQTILAKGVSALDAVTEAVRLLEDCPRLMRATGRCLRTPARTSSTRQS